MKILRLLNDFFFNNNNVSYTWEEYEKIVVDVYTFFDLINLIIYIFLFFKMFKKLFI